MIIFVAWPTTNVFKSNQNARRWRDAGYRVAVATDLPENVGRCIDASVPPMVTQSKYTSYYKAMNALAHGLVKKYKADVVIAAGDGIHPHPGVRGHDIAFAFKEHFPNGFGVMQPCGGAWSPNTVASGSQDWAKHTMHATRRTDQRCESPWVGRGIIEESAGAGPWNGRYDQYFGDHELHDVMQTAGVLWMNPALHQNSEHWAAGQAPIKDYQIKNYERSYEKDWGLYRARRLAEFPPINAPETTPGGLILP